MRYALLAIVLVAGLTACREPGEEPELPRMTDVAEDDGGLYDIEKWTDPATGVTCYIVDHGDAIGVSCLEVGP